MRGRHWALSFLSVFGVALLQGAAGAAEPVAVLTEVRAGKGEVRVKRAGESEWAAPQPLLGLRPGDQIRVTADGRAVLAFIGGGAQTVSTANSPFTVQTPRGETGGDRVRGLLSGVTQFLLGQQKEPTYQSLSVRSAGNPPRILFPRDTRVLPGPITFEWAGSDLYRYRVRVFGPQGLHWEQGNLPRRPLEYPASAPPLQPGTRYEWALDVPGQPVQRTYFEILPAPDAARVEGALAELRPAALAVYPPSTVVLMRAGLLFQEGLYAAARRDLLAGIAADPDEPTLHQLLGYVYDRVGLTELAAAEFDEAQYLSTRKP